MQPNVSSVEMRKKVKSPSVHLAYTAPKVFTLPSVRPNTPRGPNLRSFRTKLLGKFPQCVQTHLLRSSAKLLFQSSKADGCSAAKRNAYIETAPAISVSQAQG